MQLTLARLMLLLTSTSAGSLVPSPTGPYNVTLTVGPLTDYHREDRTLMLSVFQPATCEAIVHAPYMPVRTAEFQGPFIESIFNVSLDLAPIFLNARLPICMTVAARCTHLQDAPILLFSPGYSIPRLYYNVLASAIASEGFIVITIDHPGDADIITYPDGHAVYNNDTVQTTSDFKEHIPPRIADTSFVIDQLNNATAMAILLPHQGLSEFSTKHVAMFGHSLGGVTAVLAAAEDPRIRGAVNWDGTFVDLPPSSGVHQPVLLMSHGDADSTWLAAWPRFKGPKLWVNVANTTHETFTDIPTLLEAAGQDNPALDALLGAIAPPEMVRISTAYTTTWMNGVFKDSEGGPLYETHQLARFPQASTVRRGNF